MSELRYHPFLETWVITATHRQDRTFHPPAGYCPLCPTAPGGFPTEVPFEDYDIVVIENKFPSLSMQNTDPTVSSNSVSTVRESLGVCEVVLYSSDHQQSFATLPFKQVRKLVRVWTERFLELGKLPEVEYVFIFENKGKEIGVTLSHPHGQIYAYPFIPPVIVQEQRAENEHFQRTGKNLYDAWLEMEIDESDSRRVVMQNESFVALVPFFARYPYEVHVVAKGDRLHLGEFEPHELDDLAEILLILTRKFDVLFEKSLPYIMAMHQSSPKEMHRYSRFHVEFYPPHRTADKLKYLAGSEAGAGAFINDTLPEETAATLRNLKVPGVAEAFSL